MRATNRSTSAVGVSPKFSQAELSLQLLKRKSSFADFIPKPRPTLNNKLVKSQPTLDAGEAGGRVDSHDLLTTALFLPQSINVGNHPASPIDNVRRLLEEANVPVCSSTDCSHGQAPLFCEMLYLSMDEDGEKEDYGTESGVPTPRSPLRWQQTNRWIKYEQTVEGGSTRFSKPHITLLTVHSLLQVKNCLKKGLVLLDVDAGDFPTLARLVTNEWSAAGSLDDGEVELVRNVLNAPKMHLVRKKMRKIDEDTSNKAIKQRRGSAELKVPALQTPTFVLTGEQSNGFKSQEEDDNEHTNLENGNARTMKKLPPDTDAAIILVANVPTLPRPLSAFIRLRGASLLYPQVPSTRIPTKFLFVLLNPRDNYQNETTGIGRVFGALFSDEIFQKVAYFTHERHTLVDSVDEFISQIVAVPPGKCHPDARWDPVDNDSSENRNVGMLYAHYDRGREDPFGDGSDNANSGGAQGHHEARRIRRTGRLFGGLMADLKRKVPWFASDFTDFFRGRLSQSLATTVLMFFANISNIITFGAVMERALHHQIAAIENIVCGGISGIVFGLLGGQPLNILSATGPTLVFEKILYDFCLAYQWEFLPFRFWVGVWIAIYLLVLVATDASALVGLITRFTEEAFASLISIVFIIQAFEKLYEIGHEAPITRHPEEVLHSACHCVVSVGSEGGNASQQLNTAFKNLSVGVTKCRELGGTPQGLQCFFKPDVYLFSVLLTFGTFFIATKLNDLRRSAYLTSRLRNLISDFGVLIAIVSMTILTYFIGLEVPSLNVPSTFRPTLNRSWLVDVTAIEGAHVIIISSLPALFYTILIVMDQQITAVIVNRKDNRLRKGSGYHLDLLVVMLLVLVCSLLGLPYYVAATVLSVMHLDALKLQKESVAPGEKPHFLGIKEQRLTTIFAHVLIGMSVMLTSLVKLVPLPVLTGIFLYMGLTSLMGQQFVQRIRLLFMPVKHMPDFSWLRLLKMRRVHLFTIIQIASIAALFAVKYATTVSMMFPLMLVVMVLIRIHLLPRIFTKKELEILDDRLPSFEMVWNPRRKTVVQKEVESGVPVDHISLKPLMKLERTKTASTSTNTEHNALNGFHPTEPIL